MSRKPGFPRAAACLRERRQDILEAWELEVRKRRGYSADEPSSPALRNDLADMIAALANALSPPAVEPVSDRAPYEHALQRFEEDVPLERLVEEYRVLRGELFRAVAECATDELAQAWPLIAAHIDRAIEESVARYSAQRTRWLREREQELEALLEDLPVGVAVAEASSGRVVHTNRELARIHAGAEGVRTVEEVAALGVERLDGAMCAPDELPIARALRGEAVGPQELRVTSPRGTAVAVEVRAKPIFDASGAVRAAVVIMSDIDERVRARAERQLLAATLGHDVRSPISTIRLAAQRLGQADASDQVKRLSGGIVRSAQRLTDLVGQLLELTRSWERPLELSRQSLDLSALVRELVEEKRAAWESPRVRVEAAAPVVGQWDRHRLVRIVENLVENARQHGDPAADVEVDVAREGQLARLSVANRGAPISPEEGARLFEPYARGGATRDAGSGLGLYIVKELVEAHGGRVVLMAGEGKNTFRVLLPIAAGDAPFDTALGAS